MPQDVTDKATVHSLESTYNRISDCFDKISSIRIKLQYLVEGEGEYPGNTDSEHPKVADPTLKVVGEETFNIEQQINLCNQLVEVLKDGGHRK